MSDIEKIFREDVKGNFSLKISQDRKIIELESQVMLGSELEDLLKHGFMIIDIVIFNNISDSTIVFKFRNNLI